MRLWRAVPCGAVSLFLVFTTLATIACGEPPDKELQAAQAAIEAARSAGAPEYAHDEFAAAEDALKHARDAVADRDYRLALNNALDSRERAQEAAREATANKASARAEASRELTNASATLGELKAQLRSASSSHAPTHLLASAESRIAAEEPVVQEARTAIGKGDYRAAVTALKGSTARLQSIKEELEDAVAPAARRRR
jgi:hypothetical protein